MATTMRTSDVTDYPYEFETPNKTGIRGRLYAKPCLKSPHPRRGTYSVPSRRPRTVWHWYAEVRQGGTILWSDNCRDRSKLVVPLEYYTRAFIELSWIGQAFKSWAQIVEEADDL